MARMTNKQIEYAVDRLRGITRALIAKLVEPEPIKQFTDKDVIKGWADGSLKLSGPVLIEISRDVVNRSPWSWDDEFFEGMKAHYHAKAKAKDETKFNKKDAVFQKAKQKIMNEARRVEDQIMLGDVEEALKLLENFASFG